MDQPLSSRPVAENGRLLAGRQLPLGRADLSYDNPLLKEPLQRRAHQAAAVGPLGHHAGPEFHLRAPQPRHQAVRPECDLHRRPRHGGPGIVANTYLEGTYSEVYPHISQDEAGMKRLFTQFSFPGGIPSHAAPETPGSIHEGRRTGLRPLARLRRGVRQPRPAGRLRGGRRRGGNRAAGHELALEQVPQPGPRRRRAADPAPERLQDRRPDRAGPHQPRGAGGLFRGYGYTPYFVEGRRAGEPCTN